MRELGEHAGGHRRTLAHVLARRSSSYVRAVVVERHDPRVLPLGVREVADRSGNPVWFQLSIMPFVLGVLRYALLLDQGDGGAPEELVLADRVLLADRRALGDLLRDRGARLS